MLMQLCRTFINYVGHLFFLVLTALKNICILQFYEYSITLVVYITVNNILTIRDYFYLTIY